MSCKNCVSSAPGSRRFFATSIAISHRLISLHAISPFSLAASIARSARGVSRLGCNASKISALVSRTTTLCRPTLAGRSDDVAYFAFCAQRNEALSGGSLHAPFGYDARDDLAAYGDLQ